MRLDHRITEITRKSSRQILGIFTTPPSLATAGLSRWDDHWWLNGFRQRFLYGPPPGVRPIGLVLVGRRLIAEGHFAYFFRGDLCRFMVNSPSPVHGYPAVEDQQEDDYHFTVNFPSPVKPSTYRKSKLHI